MSSIEYTAEIGSKTKRVKIEQVSGAAAETYHVFINSFYIGKVIRVQGELVAYLKDLAGDDVAAILGAIGDAQTGT